MQNLTPPLNNQDFFNRVWQHFIVEQHPLALNAAGRCCYRTENNNGCAVGCVLPDDLAAKADLAQLGWGITSVCNRIDAVKQWLNNVSPDLLSACQNLHDDEAASVLPPEPAFLRRQSLIELGHEFGLTVPQ